MAAVSNYDWQFIRPLDQTPNIAAMNPGNQQIQQGLAAIGNSAVGYADALKQRNTDQILNTLMGAQTSGELPQALQAVQALQQQYGRGYDQSAVRNAIDTRGTTLGQRDLQQINLQQAQAAQAAIPQLNQAAIEQAKARGMDVTGLMGMADLGIDITGQVNNAVQGFTQDRTYNRGVLESDRNYNRQVNRDQVGDAQWAEGNRRANITTAASLAQNYVTPASSGWTTDDQGNMVPTSTAGVTFGDALPAIMGSLFNVESGGVHRQADGSLTRSPKGALGTAQIMPATAAKPGYGMSPINLHTSSPQQQQAWATEYISRIADKHKFTTEQAVAAYNAGPGAVQNAIKKSPNNWLAQLPKETQNYVPKVLGGAGIQGSGPVRSVPQANLSKATSVYQDAITKLDGQYNAKSAQDQVKGSLASTGKNVDTWAASNRGKDSTFFTSAGDLASMAKKDPTFAKLPQDAQINVLNGAFAKMNDVNSLQYVKDSDLQKYISTQSKQYSVDRKNQYTAQRKQIQEQAYQDIVQQYQAAGMSPPNRESVLQLLDPKPKPVAQPQPQPKAATKPVNQPKAQPAKSAQADTRLDDYLVRRNAERAARVPAPKPAAPKAQSKPVQMVLPSGKTSLTPKEVDELFKKYQVR